MADEFLAQALPALAAGRCRPCTATRRRGCRGQGGWCAATEEDFGTEYNSLDLSAAVVDSLEDAVQHIRQYSSGHTDAIITRSQAAARRFVQAVDSAAVVVNASTRFTDGGEFGFGAEIGISTQKLHARGPMGLPEMTSTKYVVTGEGQIRTCSPQSRARHAPATTGRSAETTAIAAR